MTLLVLSGFLLGEVFGAYDVIPDRLQPAEFGGGMTTSLTYTNSVSRIATVSSSVLSARTSRQYAKCERFDYVSQSDTVFVTFGSTASKNYGFVLRASGSFEITHNNAGEIYVGPITAVIESETGSTSLNYGRFNCVEQY